MKEKHTYGNIIIDLYGLGKSYVPFPQHPPLAQLIYGGQTNSVAGVGLELRYGVLLVLAAVHLRPLPVAAEELQHKGNDPGAIVLEVVRGPPGEEDVVFLSYDYFSVYMFFCLFIYFALNSDNFWGGAFIFSFIALTLYIIYFSSFQNLPLVL